MEEAEALCTKMAIAQYGLGDYKESLILANKAVNMFMQLSSICQFTGYVEIRPSDERMAWQKEEVSKLFNSLTNLNKKLKNNEI